MGWAHAGKEPVNWGWVDYNDVTTQSAAIALTDADTFYKLTNDGAGAQSHNEFKPSGHGEIWNVSTNQLDFSSLAVGDQVHLRIALDLIASGVNREFDLKLNFAIGGSFPFSLLFDHRPFKAAGTFPVLIERTFYIGSSDVKSNPAEILMSSDGTGDTVKVGGFLLTTFIR